MQVCEIIFPASDDGGIDDAISDHLDGAVKCDQGGRTGCRDGIAWPHEPILIADEAGRCTVESAHECSVVGGHASGFHLPFDGALLIRREVNGSVDGCENIVNICPNDCIGEGPRRLSRVLGDEDADSFARDVRIQDAGCLDCLFRLPHGDLC